MWGFRANGYINKIRFFDFSVPSTVQDEGGLSGRWTFVTGSLQDEGGLSGRWSFVTGSLQDEGGLSGRWSFVTGSTVSLPGNHKRCEYTHRTPQIHLSSPVPRPASL